MVDTPLPDQLSRPPSPPAHLPTHTANPAAGPRAGVSNKKRPHPPGPPAHVSTPPTRTPTDRAPKRRRLNSSPPHVAGPSRLPRSVTPAARVHPKTRAAAVTQASTPPVRLPAKRRQSSPQAPRRQRGHESPAHMSHPNIPKVYILDVRSFALFP